MCDTDRRNSKKKVLQKSSLTCKDRYTHGKYSNGQRALVNEELKHKYV